MRRQASPVKVVGLVGRGQRQSGSCRGTAIWSLPFGTRARFRWMPGHEVSISQLVEAFDTDVTVIQAVITVYTLVIAARQVAGGAGSGAVAHTARRPDVQAGVGLRQLTKTNSGGRVPFTRGPGPLSADCDAVSPPGLPAVPAYGGGGAARRARSTGSIPAPPQSG